MSTRVKLWGLTTLVAVVFIGLGLLASELLSGDEGPGWLLRLAFVVLGLTAAFVTWRFLATRWKGHLKREALAAREDEIRSAFQSAKKRLAKAVRGGKPRIGKLPVVLVLGPVGAAKTTVVSESGTDPELIGGEAYRDDLPVPTAGVNIWYVEESVVVEAGGRLLDDEDRFGALLDHVQPDRLGPALGLGEQAPRTAVVCVPCDEFVKPGAAEGVPALARRVRERLVDTAQAMGVQLPVYVLFTRADRLPHFEDYVKGMRAEELASGLGATLPAPAPTSEGVWAQEEARRVGDAFERMVHHLALARREVLRRENDPETQGGAYEFPREVGKIGSLARQFLVEVTRPTQLGVNPFLRGFHFVGVRPVVVADSSGSPAPQLRPETPSFGATAVFDPSQLQAAAQAPSGGGTRRIPEWVFLQPFIREVVLGDRTARVLTTGGAKVDVLRRALLTLVALAGLVFLVGATISFRENRAVAERVRTAGATVAAIERDQGQVPTAAELEALDSLRAPLAFLLEAREDRPGSMRWGLWRGDRVLEPGIRIWLSSFDRVIGTSARGALLAWMGELPDTPSAEYDYGQTYDALKAYLILTSHPRESDTTFVGPAVSQRWPAIRTMDEASAVVARRQIDFYARVLAEGWRDPIANDESTVERTRVFLRAFQDADRHYQRVLAEAAPSGRDIHFAQEFPGAAGTVRDDYVVPAAFTLEGWNAVQAELAGMDFSAEDWVVGGTAMVSADAQEELARGLRERYEGEFVSHWTSFMEGATVPPFGGPQDAANRLARLADAQSPLLQLLALASRNTRVDPARVGSAFQPLHAVSPPEVEDRYVGEWNQGYREALGDLQAAMDQVETSQGPAREGARQQANSAANSASRAVSTMAEAFVIESEAQPMAAAVRAFLEAPIRRAERLINELPSGDLNNRGGSFCRGFGSLLDGFPFRATAGNEVSMEDLAGALQPGTGLLWTFHQDVLDGLLVLQGSRWVARPGADPPPTPAFVDFFNRAAAASSAFFDQNRPAPEIPFVLGIQTSAAIPQITVRIDGQTQTFTPTQTGDRPFVWQGATARDASISGVVDGQERALLEVPAGPWALFRLFQLARWEPLPGSRYRLTWDIPGVTAALTGELRLGSGVAVPIFQRSFLEGLTCVSRIAR